MGSSLLVDPFLWAGLTALFAGLAGGQGLRAFAAPAKGRVKAIRLRSRRIARAVAHLSLAILAAAALFVLADKAALAAAWAGPRAILLAWSALALVLGLCAGFRPLLLGLPLASLVGLALGLLRMGLEGWIPLRFSGNAAVEIASLLPYEVGPASFRGQLELPERDSVPVAQDVGLASSAAALRVESLEREEPRRLAARLALSKARAAASPSATSEYFYRVVGLAAPGVAGEAFATPRYARVLDAVLPLPAGQGLEPAGAIARAQALFGLAERMRRTSSAAPLVALEPLSFRLDAHDLSITPR
jgi:hypothetical protein